MPHSDRWLLCFKMTAWNVDKRCIMSHLGGNLRKHLSFICVLCDCYLSISYILSIESYLFILRWRIEKQITSLLCVKFFLCFLFFRGGLDWGWHYRNLHSSVAVNQWQIHDRSQPHFRPSVNTWRSICFCYVHVDKEALSCLTRNFLEHFLKHFVTDVFCLYNSILTSVFVFSSIGLFAVKKT